MDKPTEIEENREELLKGISTNYSNHDFLVYMNHCVEVWQSQDSKNSLIENAIKAVCNEYQISREELIKSNLSSNYYIRGAMCFSIKKMFNLSYNEISILLGRHKSYAHKIVSEVETMLKTNGHKVIKDVVLLVESELQKKPTT
jgi:chromosomal replication initiation ATPase DnaA